MVHFPRRAALSLRILFATMAPVQQAATGPTSELASARYRALVPARELTRLGHPAGVASLPRGKWTPDVALPDCDVLVISKSFDPANEALAERMKARGVAVVVDFCDDYFGDPEHGPHFRNLAALADRIVAATEAMGEAIRAHTGRDSVVVPDPVEGPRGVPRFAPQPPVMRLAWFGHPSNLDGVLAKAAELQALARRAPVRLTFVTTDLPAVHALGAHLAQGAGGRIETQVVPWSTQATWDALAATDAVWIPVADSSRKAVKSANRLVESLWAGRFVVADPLPSYAAYGDLVPLGAGLERALDTALAAPARVEAGIAEAQRRIERIHSPAACARQWAAVLGEAMSARAGTNARSAP